LFLQKISIFSVRVSPIVTEKRTIPYNFGGAAYQDFGFVAHRSGSANA
jgi:hypothetical protein